MYAARYFAGSPADGGWWQALRQICNICIYVYMYVCIYIYIYIHMCICICISIHSKVALSSRSCTTKWREGLRLRVSSSFGALGEAGNY